MYLGIDIGGTRIKAGLVAENGVAVRTVTATSPATKEALEATLEALARQALEKGQRPAAAGFGCKGIVDPETTEVRTLPGMWGYLVGMKLRDVLRGIVAPDTPVAADNDAKAALAGELVWGAARGRRNVVLLTLGTGVGGAALVDGRILRGAWDVGGHLGHVTVDPNGARCICGNYGCLETVFSARAIEAEAWSATHQGCSSPMCDTLRANRDALDCRFVFEQAAMGDPIAKGILEKKIRLLAGAIAGLLHAFDPEIVILSGNVAEAGEALFQPLQMDVDWRVQGLLRRTVPIVPSGVNDTSGVVGAAALAKMAAGGGGG